MIKDVEFHDVVDQRFLVRLEIGRSHRDISSIVSDWICRCESVAVVSILDDLVDSINSTEKVAFDNFSLALKGEANVWLDSQIILTKIEGDREQWSIIRPYFKEEFATESDDKLILDGLAHMAMRPTENVRSFFGRINAVNKVIKDAYDSYTLTPADPVADNAGNITMTTANFQAYKKALIDNIMEFNILNQFRAALLPELR